ncbi:GSCOCG00002603001-RA-CDS [Cotesia congregata]|uniref:Similar to ANKDD1A: Ankyrin repeat and death domain-containing protein 1A (Homo sapiens) n=1 Tax=Cotesia congregata TaxID=51543 RepID=A0A8J2MQH6_COTCN|nr:GSCOCG00002603001-RA-CDS [Cotesia congregata]CAG5101700.1 Similar to ANKDD1A: Ankyrin repeat and death domain-containing protein 1A (Homo sapiens) [Cotesia congregata]
MGDLTRSSATKMKIPPPLNLSSDPDDDSYNQKSRILKNDLLLHEAVIKNEPETVKKVLEETVDVNSRNNYGRAPIHWAASRGNTEIIELLMKADCDIEAKDKFGMRPLHMAAWYGHLDAVKLLVDAGANVEAVNKKKYTLLMCGSRGSSSIVIEYLIKVMEFVNVEATDNTGATALHHAAISGHPDVIKALSRIPGIKFNVTDKKGQTPLHCACAEGHMEAVETLINLGSNLNDRDNDGYSPLHVATRMRNTGIVQILLNANANCNITDDNGLTSLHMAASQGCKGILESIIDYCPDVINKQCNIGNTPLHLACQNNQMDTIEILLKKKADINCLNLKLQTPIHIAAEMGHTDVCKLLLAAGANIEQREKGGRTPLYIAARGSFTAIVDMIIKTARLGCPDSTVNDEDGLVRKKFNEPRWSTISANCAAVISDHIRSILWKLAYKHLENGDWKKLALHWSFTHEQIQAIEHQYDGPSSYKEHGHRMLMIWTSSLSPDTQVHEQLYQALCAIDKKNTADSIRKKYEEKYQDEKKKSGSKSCHQCLVS